MSRSEGQQLHQICMQDEVGRLDNYQAIGCSVVLQDNLGLTHFFIIHLQQESMAEAGVRRVGARGM